MVVVVVGVVGVVVAAVAAVASALEPRGGLALKCPEISSSLAGGGCCWRGWSARGWRCCACEVNDVGCGGGCWLLLAWVVVVFFSAAGRYGVLRGGVSARWYGTICLPGGLSLVLPLTTRRLAAVDTAARVGNPRGSNPGAELSKSRLRSRRLLRIG